MTRDPEKALMQNKIVKFDYIRSPQIRSYFGSSRETELVDVLSQEINLEIDREVLMDLRSAHRVYRYSAEEKRKLIEEARNIYRRINERRDATVDRPLRKSSPQNDNYGGCFPENY